MPEADAAWAVRLDQVTKVYRTGEVATPALRGVNLEVKRGELLMIVGPSGCGKTTLLSIISGTLRPDTGSVRVLGQSIESAEAAEAAQFRSRHVGFVFQQFNLIPSITVWENVSVPLLIQRVPMAEAKKRSLEVLNRMGLSERAHVHPNQLSGGQQQRVAIARALVHHPEIVVCDEPTSALDAATGEQIMMLLEQLTHESDRTVVVVTHDARIFRFADRIAEMEDGRIIRHGPSPSPDADSPP